MTLAVGTAAATSLTRDSQLTFLIATLAALYGTISIFFYALWRWEGEFYLSIEADKIQRKGPFFLSEIRFDRIISAWMEEADLSPRHREQTFRCGPYPCSSIYLVFRTRFRRHKIYLSAEDGELYEDVRERLGAHGWSIGVR